MTQFHFRGRESNGNSAEGRIEASDVNSAAKMLNIRRIVPIQITPVKTEKSHKVDDNIHFLTPNVSLDDLVIFCRQMYSLTKAGISVIRAMHGLANNKSARLRAAVLDVIDQLERGRPMSSAMHRHPKIFNQLFVSVVHVGENTGQLDAAFAQLATYLEREQETRKQIKAATRYPMFVIIALVIAFVIMNIVVIPVFAGMFEKFNAELPTMTVFLLAMSEFFVTQWYYLLGFLLLSIFITKKYIDTQTGRLKWDHLKITLPIIGSIIERSLLARFSRSFSMMVRSGVPLTTALNLVADAVDNKYMGDKIIEMRRTIEKGESFSRVANSSKLFTPLVLQMISVGEETGRIDELLKEVAEFYEREVDYDLKSLTSKIEPILISIVAGMVLVLALGIFTPMWDMMGAVQGK